MTAPSPGGGSGRPHRVPRGRVVGGVAAAAMLLSGGVFMACSGDEVTPTTEIPPAVDTMPVNSMVNHSAMVPGATLEPVAPGGPNPPAPAPTVADP